MRCSSILLSYQFGPDRPYWDTLSDQSERLIESAQSNSYGAACLTVAEIVADGVYRWGSSPGNCHIPMRAWQSGARCGSTVYCRDAWYSCGMTEGEYNA